MDYQANKKSIFSLICIFLSSIFISCSQNSPSISITSFSIVYDYVNEQSYPDARMSVFIETAYDIRKAKSFSVKAVSNNYIWTAENPVIFENENTNFLGYSNFLLPVNEQFPNGEYEIKFTTKDENFVSTTLNINYYNDFYNITADKVEQRMKNLSYDKRLCIYDEVNTLIYFGDRTEEVSSKELMLHTYPNAKYYREAYVTRNTICMLPIQKLAD